MTNEAQFRIHCWVINSDPESPNCYFAEFFNRYFVTENVKNIVFPVFAFICVDIFPIP